MRRTRRLSRSCAPETTPGDRNQNTETGEITPPDQLNTTCNPSPSRSHGPPASSRACWPTNGSPERGPEERGPPFARSELAESQRERDAKPED